MPHLPSFLLLLTLYCRYCMCHLPGFLGTSSVLAVTLLDQLARQLSPEASPQLASALRLSGTLAHEVCPFSLACLLSCLLFSWLVGRQADGCDMFSFSPSNCFLIEPSSRLLHCSARS